MLLDRRRPQTAILKRRSNTVYAELPRSSYSECRQTTTMAPSTQTLSCMAHQGLISPYASVFGQPRVANGRTWCRHCLMISLWNGLVLKREDQEGLLRSREALTGL